MPDAARDDGADDGSNEPHEPTIEEILGQMMEEDSSESAESAELGISKLEVDAARERELQNTQRRLDDTPEFDAEFKSIIKSLFGAHADGQL